MYEKHRHRKFVIGVNGRSGTTRYAFLLNNIFYDGLYKKNIFFAGDTNPLDWSFPINHTHNLKHFLTAPAEVERIWARRNFLQMAVSEFVAKHTQVYHLFDDKSSDQYVENFHDKKFYMDVDKFYTTLRTYGECYHIIAQHIKLQKNIVWHQCMFEYHVLRKDLFYQLLNLPFNIEPEVVKAMSLDKYSLIGNLKEIIDVYENHQCNYDIFKRQSVETAKRSLAT